MPFSVNYTEPKTIRKIETPLKTQHKADRNCPNYSKLNGTVHKRIFQLTLTCESCYTTPCFVEGFVTPTLCDEICLSIAVDVVTRHSLREELRASVHHSMMSR